MEDYDFFRKCDLYEQRIAELEEEATAFQDDDAICEDRIKAAREVARNYKAFLRRNTAK